MSLIEEKLALLPDKPGSYQMLDELGNIIYVGKAKNLKNRVRSYFHGAHNAKTTKLVSEIRDFRYIITESELEAYVLEINLIKEYLPKYNIALTDDKTYPYIALTNELNPRLIVTRNPRKKNKAKYYGPYPNVKAARETVTLLNRLYPLRKCNKMGKELCLYYHMGQCLGPCVKNEKIDYSKYKSEINSFLNGNAKDILNELEKKMNDCSNNLEYEKAIEYRDLINSINYTINKQKISINDLTSRDYVGVYVLDDNISINIIMTRLGNIVQNHQTILNLYDSLEDEVINYLIQFYELNTKPKEIASIGIDLEEYKEILGIDYIKPQLGKKKELLDMALYNAKFNIENRKNLYHNRVLKKVETIENLGKLLGINTPLRIEAFDNSNLFGEYPVSAMVTYINGKPSPKDFRKYHINTVKGPNDFESMKEVVYRRYYRLLMEDGPFPDLIIMDGGKIQVHACLSILDSLNLDIPVLGIQKDDNHKACVLFFEEKLISVSKNSDIFLLISDISQRVHDFAISFFRSRKGKGLFNSHLDNIKGLGKKRKELLMEKFITVENLKKATLEELKECHIPENVCAEIINYFKEVDNNV